MKDDVYTSKFFLFLLECETKHTGSNSIGQNFQHMLCSPVFKSFVVIE